MKINIFGDLCPTKLNNDLFAKRDTKQLFNDILPIIKSSDLSIVNLECPLTNHNKKILKSGPHLKAPRSSFNGINEAGFKLFSLANNHIMDYGSRGLNDTIELIKYHKKNYIGAGEDKSDSKKVFYYRDNLKTIGVFSIADNEFGNATDEKPGSNGMDFLQMFDDIYQARLDCDYLIVLLHSGIEHYVFPSPLLKSICHKMIDNGADIVVCQHSHILGTYEIYKNKHIIYGQGNFLFSKEKRDLGWRIGMIIEITIIDNDISIEFLPSIMTDVGVELLKNENKNEVLDIFNLISEKVQDNDFIKFEWEKHCKSNTNLYLSLLNGFDSGLIKLNKILKGLLTKLTFTQKRVLKTHNLLRCTYHREILDTILELEEKKRNRNE